ncbi:metal ABC transporter solute-binding protein, Zn/Mn family [Pediococcus siamensis]|uniref:metal ABC transporter solute-binding protein, Zn/Mn family n=1 Tax=Pediococcus siamensis TaxID=381829 RepID=UPI0039A18D88
MITKDKLLRNYLLKFGVMIAVLLMSGMLTACHSTKKASHNDKLKIVATTDFYGEAAKAVVGSKGTVKSVIHSATVDPHDYEPTTSVASEVSQADVVIASGIGYDSWMNKLVKNGKSTVVDIKIGEDVMGKKMGDNPHIWYNPQTMPRYVKYLANKLSKRQPKNKAYFHKNAQKYVQSLQPINREIAKLKTQAAQKKYNKVFVSEPVFDYALEALGYQVADQNFENAMEKGVDPAVQEIKKMQTEIKARKIAFFVYNEQASDKTVTNFVKLAKKSKVPVLKVTETLPSHENYKQWMLSQYQELSSILSN